MPDIEIRKGTLNDLSEIQTLFADTIKSTCKKDYSKTQIEAWISSIENKERWINKLTKQYFLVAEMNAKIVGFASLESGQYLDFMYVHKDYLRQGIADMLYQELELESRKSGYTKISSDVSITAKPFFEEKGFKVDKENRFSMKGVEIINFRMTKESV